MLLVLGKLFLACAEGNVARLFTTNCYATIEHRTSWAQPLNVSAAIRDELSLWLSNIDTINGRVMSPKSSTIAVVYSDATDSGFCGYFVQCGVDLVSGVWSEVKCIPAPLLGRFWRLNLFYFPWLTSYRARLLKGSQTIKMYLELFRLGVVKVICSPKLCLFLTSAVIMAF